MKATWKNTILVFILICTTFLFSLDADAQCAMCKAVSEDSANEGGIGAGINKGIVYLMAVPYLLLGGLFFFFFRKKMGSFFREFNEIH